MRITALLLVSLSVTALAQGPLAPPAAPAPSMKTLDQIEARTPIPATPVGFYPYVGPPAYFTISQSGSYYLTGNLTVPAGKDAIVIVDGVNDVTLDLNGFTIKVDTDHGWSGINMKGSHARITIYNGNIDNGDYHTDPGSGDNNGGIVGGTLKNIHVSRINVRNITGYGIRLGNYSIISECSAYSCSRSGLVAETVTNSNASKCRGEGISAKNANNCTGSSTGSSTGLYCSGNATNCNGVSDSGSGLVCAGNATNCRGNSYFHTGLECYGNATNCTGVSFNKTGLACGGNASNCTGKAGIGNGLIVTGTANTCTGDNDMPGSVALTAGIAIGCTSSSGIISSPQKHLGTL